MVVSNWGGTSLERAGRAATNTDHTNFEDMFALRLLGMSWCVKTTCLEASGVSLGGSGVSIGGIRSLRVKKIWNIRNHGYEML